MFTFCVKLKKDVTKKSCEQDTANKDEEKQLVYQNIACYLIEHGNADILVKNDIDQTPLHHLLRIESFNNTKNTKRLALYLANFFLSHKGEGNGSSTLSSQLKHILNAKHESGYGLCIRKDNVNLN